MTGRPAAYAFAHARWQRKHRGPGAQTAASRHAWAGHASQRGSRLAPKISSISSETDMPATERVTSPRPLTDVYRASTDGDDGESAVALLTALTRRTVNGGCQPVRIRLRHLGAIPALDGAGVEQDAKGVPDGRPLRRRVARRSSRARRATRHRPARRGCPGVRRERDGLLRTGRCSRRRSAR